MTCNQRSSARRASRLGAIRTVSVRPHVEVTQRCLFLKPPDNTRRSHAESNSTLEFHPRCLSWRLHGTCNLLQLPTPVENTPISWLLICRSHDDSRPTHHRVVPLSDSQATQLIDCCCPNQATEPRWEHDVHLPSFQFCLVHLSSRQPNAQACSTQQSQKSPMSFLGSNTARHLTINSFPILLLNLFVLLRVSTATKSSP